MTFQVPVLAEMDESPQHMGSPGKPGRHEEGIKQLEMSNSVSDGSLVRMIKQTRLLAEVQIVPRHAMIASESWNHNVAAFEFACNHAHSPWVRACNWNGPKSVCENRL